MAQKVQIILEDDLSGGVATGTVAFALEGVSYEIDLSDDNAARLRAAMAPWIGHARRVSGRRGAGGKKAKGGGDSATEIRAWARQQGLEVSARGRVPSEVRQAYERAHH